MTDKISLDRIALLHPRVREEARALCSACSDSGAAIRVTQGLRTFGEQDALYNQGRTKPGLIVTRARGGYSYHNYGLALDFCLLNSNGGISWDSNSPAWDTVVKIFTGAGWGWGGLFGDRPHFEKSFNLSVDELKKRYDNNQCFIDPATSNCYVMLLKV